ncbi:MAG: DUF4266 domain-containing protein [candidate division FCPU426 bacterium]
MRARLFILIALLAAAGCATVKPWEKEVLSQPQMSFSHDGLDQHFIDHAVMTIEQAEGGAGGAGGGCGCR